MKPTSTPYSLAFLLLLGACEEVRLPDDIGAPGERPVLRAGKAPPILGGTLLVSRDGAYAVVSDPPRDAIHIVDLQRWEETGTIQLEDGALPFRATEDDTGRVHVTLRGTGELATIDPSTASVTETTTVCPNPRGVAFDGDTGDLHVACAGGVLATLPESGAVQQRYIAPDLRDVFVSEGRLYVTRFRAAEILEVDDEGGWSLAGGPVTLVTGSTSREPTTAWRTIPTPEGGWLMLHQSASTDPVPGFQEPGTTDGAPSQGDNAGYTGTSDNPCTTVTNVTLSTNRGGSLVYNAGVLGGMALAVDAAVSPDGLRVAVATPAQQGLEPEGLRRSVFELWIEGFTTDTTVHCDFPDPRDVDDDIVAVAYEAGGTLLAQARDEPILYRIHNSKTERLRLVGDPTVDTGFDLFHNDAGGGIACASCHPEGGEDGRTWIFEDLGPRRTQALNVGLEGTAPFHWKGDMDDIHMIARQVRERAMGGAPQSEERQTALQDWLFALHPANPIRESDGSVAEGQQLFEAVGCASCHAGESFTSPASADLGLGPLQTPALRGVALRPPYMHDGRAATLEDAVRDMTRTTAPDANLSDGQITSIVVYLESL